EARHRLGPRARPRRRLRRQTVTDAQVESAAPAPPEPRPRGTSDAATRLRHLWHRFGAADVLRDVTFDVGPGEIFGFIGPNGAGQTPTIRAMAPLPDRMAGRA